MVSAIAEAPSSDLEAWMLLLLLLAAQVDDPALSFDKSVLDNGLEVLIHEDKRAPVVCVDVWYHVGAFHEERGKSGFAHLFEHLMFQGTAHVDGDGHFRLLEAAGAFDVNGST